jgi:hypothetical protein
MPLSPTRHLAENKENGKDLCDTVNLAACRDEGAAEDCDSGSVFRIAADKIAQQHRTADQTAKYAA